MRTLESTDSGARPGVPEQGYVLNCSSPHYSIYFNLNLAKSLCCLDFSTVRLGLGIKKKTGLLKDTGEDRHVLYEENNSVVLVTTLVCPGPVVPRGRKHWRGPATLTAAGLPFWPFFVWLTSSSRAQLQGHVWEVCSRHSLPGPLCSLGTVANLSRASQSLRTASLGLAITALSTDGNARAAQRSRRSGQPRSILGKVKHKGEKSRGTV